MHIADVYVYSITSIVIFSILKGSPQIIRQGKQKKSSWSPCFMFGAILLISCTCTSKYVVILYSSRYLP